MQPIQFAAWMLALGFATGGTARSPVVHTRTHTASRVSELPRAALPQADPTNVLDVELSDSGTFSLVHAPTRERILSHNTTALVTHTYTCTTDDGSLLLDTVEVATGVDGIGNFSLYTFVWSCANASAGLNTSVAVYDDGASVRVSACVSEAVDDPPGPASAPATTSFPSFIADTQLSSVYHAPGSVNCGWTVAASASWPPSAGVTVLSHTQGAGAHTQGAGAWTTPAYSLGIAALTQVTSLVQYECAGKNVCVGVNPDLALPAGFTYDVLITGTTADVSAADPIAEQAAALGMPAGGVNAALLSTGAHVRAFTHKPLPRADVDVMHTHIGYSTTGFYFYNPCDGGRFPNGTCPAGRSHMPSWVGTCETYEDTVLAVARSMVAQGIPIHHMLIDSWWYGEGIFDGVWEWEDSQALMSQVQSFPSGLQSTVSQMSTILGRTLTMWAHNGKWVPSSPYAAPGSGYEFGQGTTPQGPSLWNHLFSANSQGWKLATIKQDHVGDQIQAAGRVTNASFYDAWLGGMGDGASANNVTIMYCCSPPAVLHNGINVPAAIAARASPDYVSNAPGGVRPRFQWAIGLESAFHYYALGLLPYKDTVFTNSTMMQHGGDGVPSKYAPSFYNFTEKNAPLHLLHAALSHGAVTFSDAVDSTNVSLVRAVMMADGRILRTSRPQTAIEQEWYSVMNGAWPNGTASGALGSQAGRGDSELPNANRGEVYSSVTIVPTNSNSSLTWHTIVATQLSQPLTLTAAELAINASSVQWASFTWSVDQFAPNADLQLVFSGPSAAPNVVLPTGSSDYAVPPTVCIIAPVLNGTWVLLGEVEKLVPVSAQRIIGMTVSEQAIVVQLDGAGAEPVTLAACALSTNAATGNTACVVQQFTCPAPGALSLPAGTCS